MYLEYAKQHKFMQHRTRLIRFLIAGIIGYSLTFSVHAGEIRTLRVQYIDTESGESPRMPERPVLFINGTTPIGVEGDINGHLLEISFDEMSQDFRQYTYTIRHCDARGVPDNLASVEYLQGYTTQAITDYTPSVNTQQVYTHYRFLFPNEDMRLTLSGRYELSVYEDNNPDLTVARIPIYVCEARVRIDGKVLSTTDIELSGRYQQLELEVVTDGRSTALRDDYFIVVQQNGRFDNQVYAPQPTFVDSRTLRWQHAAPLIFEGGDEYRHFDAYSTYFAGTGIDRVVYELGDYHALLNADELRADKPYSHEYDVNGQYRINAERVNNPDTEGEYMWVHWLLHADRPFFDGAVYVGGDLFGNACTLRNRMDYDAEHKCYYLSAPLKQGGYDYQYWFMPKNGAQATLFRTEGSHWETRNEYTVFVYYRPFGARYDQLVGIKTL